MDTLRTSGRTSRRIGWRINLRTSGTTGEREWLTIEKL